MVKLTLEEMLIDALVAEKFMLTAYDQFIKEASNMPFINLLLNHFDDLVKTQHELFLEMKERNFYPVEMAEKQKIEQSLVMLKQKAKDYSKEFKSPTTQANKKSK